MLSTLLFILIVDIAILAISMILARKSHGAHSYALILGLGISAVLSPGLGAGEGGIAILPAIFTFFLSLSVIFYNLIPFSIIFIFAYFAAYRR